MGRGRIENIFADLKLDWTRDCNSLQAKLAVTGNFGGSVGVDQAMSAFEARALEVTQAMLGEIANAVRVRNKLWHRLHDYALDLVPHFFADLHQEAEAMMYRGKGVSGIAERRAGLILAKMNAMITLHAAGWSAPEPEHWTQRNPVTYAIIMLLLGAIAGAAAAPLADFATAQLAPTQVR